MRNISVALTTRQIIAREKTQTRRLGWRFVRRGDLLQPVEKCQGLKAGERVQRVGGPVRVVAVRREPLEWISLPDVTLEGFPEMTQEEFIAMFCKANKCERVAGVTVITFEYVEEGSADGNSTSAE